MNTSTNGSGSRDERLSDTAFERLRAADPAATTEPDLTAIRATVTSSFDAPVTAGVVDLAAQRERRRPARWLQVAAASAGVLAVGVGGYALGTSPSDSGTVVAGPGAGAGTSAAVDRPAAPPVGAPETGSSFAAADSRASDMMFPLGAFRTTFSSTGLGDATTTAHAFSYDPSTTFTPENAAAIAAVLGVEGEPVLQYGAWHIGSTDWTAPSVDLQSDAATSFSYNNPTVDVWSDESDAQAVGFDAAAATLRDLMTAAGVDPAGYDITEQETSDRTTDLVATPLADAENGAGQWSITVSTAGVLYAYGQIAPVVDLGEYGVVGPETAVARLTDPRFGATPDFSVLARTDISDTQREMLDPSFTADVAPDDPAAVPTLPATPAPGSSFTWPVTHVTLTGATLTTTQTFAADGSVAFVPAYRLTSDDGSAWTVVALADAHLDFAAQG